jgi:carboxyl-terminal processing protease
LACRRLLASIPIFFLAVLALLAGVPVSLFAANVARDQLRQEAEEFEKKGEWERAGEIYWKIFSQDQQSPVVRQKLLLCMRHVQQARRHQDPVYREQVRALSFSKSLKGYAEALQKLQANYVDRDKVSILALFQHGLDEFVFALNEPAFRQQYLTGNTATIESFVLGLRDEWRPASFKSLTEVTQAVREIALSAQKSLGLRPGITVMEFVCGACNALDERSSYLPPTEDQVVAAGQLTALGMSVSANAAGQLIIDHVVPGSWAAHAELKEGEQIRLGRKPNESGEAEQLNDIVVSSHGMKRTLQLPADMPSVFESQFLSPGVGYLRLASFQKNTPNELSEQIYLLTGQGMKVLVLDLRGNPGGLFPVAVQVAERFLPGGIIVTTQGQAGPYNRTYESQSGMTAHDVPLILLVDADTASAAELLAGALKENQRAFLIGQRTYGKGTVQTVLQLSSTGGMRITLARFFSPRGEPYNGLGVAPHIVETMNPRELALEHAKSILAMQRE